MRPEPHRGRVATASEAGPARPNLVGVCVVDRLSPGPPDRARARDLRIAASEDRVAPMVAIATTRKKASARSMASEGRSSPMTDTDEDHRRAGRITFAAPPVYRSRVAQSARRHQKPGANVEDLAMRERHDLGRPRGFRGRGQHCPLAVATGPHAPQGALGCGPGRSIESGLSQHQRASATTDEPRSPPNRPMGTAPRAGWGRNLMDGPNAVEHSSWHVSQDGSQPRPDDTGARA
jgi:hypothetical protein